MKNKKKIILISSFILIVLVGITCIYFSYGNNTNKIPESFAIFVEETPGNFVKQDVSIWPTDMLFDADRSYCTYGSDLTWNSEDNSVVMASGGADECFIYFKLPPDIAITRLTLDDNPITAYPVKSNNLMVDVTCSNARGKWNRDDWTFEVDNITGKAQCSVEFTTNTPVTLASHIIGLDTAGNSEIEHTNNAEYRYTGLNPDNYIWFNDEMWRVIGVFNDASHGVTGENLVKIIREDSFTYAFDTESDNSWSDSGGGATLNTLYNTYFYNGTDGTSYEGCRIYSTSIPGNCDFTVKGLDASDRSLVQNVTWYLGGFSSNRITAKGAYDAERGSDTSNGTNLTYNAPIGLMYPSDYGYASPSSCYSTNLVNYNIAECAGANWMALKSHEFTISPATVSTSSLWQIDNNKSITLYALANYGISSKPVLYLKANAQYIDGNGAEANPFIIN